MAWQPGDRLWVKKLVGCTSQLSSGEAESPVGLPTAPSTMLGMAIWRAFENGQAPDRFADLICAITCLSLIKDFEQVAHDALIRLGARSPSLKHFTGGADRVAGAYGMQPAEFVNTRAAQEDFRRKSARLHHQPDRDGKGVDAARDEPAEVALLGVHSIHVRRLRIVAKGEVLNFSASLSVFPMVSKRAPGFMSSK